MNPTDQSLTIPTIPKSLSQQDIFNHIQQIANIANDYTKQQTAINISAITDSYLEKYSNISYINEHLADICAVKVTTHHDYYLLANKLMVFHIRHFTSLNHNQEPPTFYDSIINIQQLTQFIHPSIFQFIQQNQHYLNQLISSQADFKFDYIGLKFLQSRYLIHDPQSSPSTPIEPIQTCILRQAIAVSNPLNQSQSSTLHQITQNYHQLSQHKFTHATPTILNACSNVPQLLSCFILQMSDSIEGIMKTLTDASIISKWSGGVGIGFNQIRGRNAPISGQHTINGKSKGVVSILKIAQECALTWDQGGNKRPGSFSPYLPIWHTDLIRFIKSTSHSTDEQMRASSLFHALWTCDLFFERLKQKAQWTLFDPKTAPQLFNTHGDTFNQLYLQYEQQSLGTHTVPAETVFSAICESLCETGLPYLCSNDAANSKTNHSNIGHIKASNLCAEIFEYSSPTEYACCTLASINLKEFFNPNLPLQFDFNALHETARIVTRNLNHVIDTNYYPVPETEKSNKNYRPIAIGIQGLANLFALMRTPFTSPQARVINRYIAETIYHAALTESNTIAITDPSTIYSRFQGSPTSQSILQYDLWNSPPQFSQWDWTTLKQSIAHHGLTNSLLIAYMPTASTSHLFQNRESFEPFTSNLYQHHSNVGQFLIFNQHLVQHLSELGLWNQQLANDIINNDGSIQAIPSIPPNIKEIYKTIWEIKQMHLIDMAADRAPFVDQSQSLNLYVPKVTFNTMKKLILHGQSRGLKTLSYYTKSKPAISAEKTHTFNTSTPSVTTPLACNRFDTSCQSCSG